MPSCNDAFRRVPSRIVAFSGWITGEASSVDLALNNENRMCWALSLSLFQNAVGPNRLHSRPQQYIGADKQVQTYFVSVRNHNQYRRVVSLRCRVDGDDTLHSATRLRLHWALGSSLSRHSPVHSRPRYVAQCPPALAESSRRILLSAIIVGWDLETSFETSFSFERLVF